ncbi:hypothetical protein K505DRAFT_331295 [Melanomma pulvis-pyrius CBS 109.77]|uniref:Uncharacterized protein n=1 Tax=Melanomma pulvis-pyrius CBS 109.77 TaxID=1314802 RepID=A0A6A6XZ67_9PLEO|nr:hypothetical protein K505DRAFT_331295 [Melanomma pulvis-pyrius CBS 109.77]
MNPLFRKMYPPPNKSNPPPNRSNPPPIKSNTPPNKSNTPLPKRLNPPAITVTPPAKVVNVIHRSMTSSMIPTEQIEPVRKLKKLILYKMQDGQKVGGSGPAHISH